MNIYITEPNFGGSARNLDDVKLKAQASWLAQIINNVVADSSLYKECAEDATSIPTNKLLIPITYSNHKTVEWTKQTHVHLAFICLYLHLCAHTLGRRRYPLHPRVHKIHTLSLNLISMFDSVLPPNIMTAPLLGLENELYKSVPDKYSNEANTQLCYQQYLISQWKQQIVARHAYEIENNNRLSMPISVRYSSPPPRLVRVLKWRHEYSSPSFGHEEMEKTRQELNNASNTSTNTASYRPASSY